MRGNLTSGREKVRHKSSHSLTSHIFLRGKHSSADPVLTQHRKPLPACHDTQLHKKWIARPGGCWQPARLAACFEQSEEEYRLLPVFFQPSPWTASSPHTLVFPSSAYGGEGICGWVLSLSSASWHRAAAGPLVGAGSVLRATESQANSLLFFSLQVHCIAEETERAMNGRIPCRELAAVSEGISLP